MGYKLYNGDCLIELKNIDDNSIDSVVTDPPYHLQSIVSRFKNTSQEDENKTGEDAKSGRTSYARLAKGFMGQEWDGGDIAFKIDVWLECLRVLKPGGHLLSFGGTRTYHRMACAIEDAGFEIRDQIGWLYGTGFPKSHNVGDGWGTALKPAWEPIVMARKPLKETTVAKNIQEYGTGAINIEESRIESKENITTHSRGKTEGFPKRILEKTVEESGRKTAQNREEFNGNERTGRWPANIIHDGSEEIVSYFPESSGDNWSGKQNGTDLFGTEQIGYKSSKKDAGKGSAARFFYSAKASKEDREFENIHPTVKPQALMTYLCKLITPVGGTVLDPFMGSGSTGKAALMADFSFVGIEREKQYFDIATKRIENIPNKLF